MSVSAGLTLIGVVLFGIMLFVIVLTFIAGSRYDYDKAKATRKHNDEHIVELIKKHRFDDEE